MPPNSCSKSAKLRHCTASLSTPRGKVSIKAAIEVATPVIVRTPLDFSWM
jgi:hypothetical protein